jgi:hypothetical protein
MPRHLSVVVLFTSCALLVDGRSASSAETDGSLYGKKNLVAWCIVPFDSKKRGPAERAEMLSRLGISKVAYDWRQEHVATFEEEILQYKKHGLEYFAFWSWHPAMEPLIQKHGIRPQLWITNPSPQDETQPSKVRAAAEALLPLVEQARRLELKLGLYNHGGWGGEPANLVAVCEYLHKQLQADHVGIVYNFHHGHGHIDDFAESLAIMQPYLLCLNLNGMAEPATVTGLTNKILPIGSGTHEQHMMQIVQQSEYDGPIGILDHRSDVDAEQSLQENLDGLKKVLDRLRRKPQPIRES